MTRFIGVTGHENPAVIRRCIELFDFDTVLLPVNPAEPAYRSFIEEVIPLANEKQMGIVGMKVYFRGIAAQLPFFRSMQPFFDFAVSQQITTVVIGCDDLEQLEENVEFARSFVSMSDQDKAELISEVAPFARQLMMYKV
jgi:predicted aldo/keto reductase-like oxidoreductase